LEDANIIEESDTNVKGCLKSSSFKKHFDKFSVTIIKIMHCHLVPKNIGKRWQRKAF